MLNARLTTLNRHLKRYDSELFANIDNSGKYHVMRKAYCWDVFEWQGMRLSVSRLNPHYIFSLTNTWKSTGMPVEWGIEPILHQIQKWDNWRDDSQYEAMKKNRDEEERVRDRSLHNEIKARAYDLRRDFAKETNDFNTSTIKKIDRRRNQDGDCQ